MFFIFSCASDREKKDNSELYSKSQTRGAIIERTGATIGGDDTAKGRKLQMEYAENKMASGTYLLILIINDVIWISNIITTNINKTATAPTQTTTRIIAKNSAPNKTNRPAELKNANIRNKTECTGFFEDITITAAKTVTAENK